MNYSWIVSSFESSADESLTPNSFFSKIFEVPRAGVIFCEDCSSFTFWNMLAVEVIM